jgi:hypothetical protein
MRIFWLKFVEHDIVSIKKVTAIGASFSNDVVVNEFPMTSQMKLMSKNLIRFLSVKCHDSFFDRCRKKERFLEN